MNSLDSQKEKQWDKIFRETSGGYKQLSPYFINVFIDDKWVLANYSPKNSNLKIYSKEWNHLKSGNHICTVEIEDERGNVASEKIKISY